MSNVATNSAVEIVPITPKIGAHVSGINVTGTLDSEQQAQLRDVLDQHLVLFFDAPGIDDDAFVRLCEVFAPATGTSVGGLNNSRLAGNQKQIMIVDRAPSRAPDNDWHTDQSFKAEPAMFTVLRAVRLPTTGGDTCWANTYAAYEALSPKVREFLDGLYAVHDIAPAAAHLIRIGAKAPSDLSTMQAEFPPVVHPVVRINPETGRKALFVNRVYTRYIEGLEEDESAALLRFLYDHVSKAEFHCRYRWAEGSIAIWDNRWTQHLAILDYDERRVMERLITVGAPVQSAKGSGLSAV